MNCSTQFSVEGENKRQDAGPSALPMSSSAAAAAEAAAAAPPTAEETRRRLPDSSADMFV